MNKEDILAKSKKENKDMDLYEKEVVTKAGNAGSMTAIILATVLFVTQIVLGGGQNYALFAVFSAVPATGFIIKSIKLKRKHEIFVAVMYVILTVLCLVAHIYNLITSSTIL